MEEKPINKRKDRRRYKNPFRSQVIDYLLKYKEIKDIGGETAHNIIGAIDSTLHDLEKEDDGDMKREIIEMMYLKNTHKAEGISIKFHISKSNVYRIVNKFIYDVCVNAKLLKRDGNESEVIKCSHLKA